MKRLIALVSLALLLTAGTLFAAEQTSGDNGEQQKTRRIAMGLTVGAFTPINDEVRDLFGDTSLRIGLRPLPIDLKPRWTFAFDLGYYNLSNDVDDVKLLPITAGFVRSLNDDEDARTYVALNAGPYYGDLDAPSIGEDVTRWGLNANATLGMIFNDDWSIEGRYDYFDKLGGLDFSAFTLSASIKLNTIKF